MNHFDGRGVLVIRWDLSKLAYFHANQISFKYYVNLRNPYKAILSYWNFKRTKSHTKTVDVESLHSEEFLDFVRVGAERWLEVIKDWLQLSTSCHVILYEVNLQTSQESFSL